MIPISEVLEEAARAVECEAVDAHATEQEADEAYNMALRHAAEAVRALAAKYKGCIVAEGEPLGDASLFRGHLVNCDIDADKLPLNGKPVPLYRAKEAK